MGNHDEGETHRLGAPEEASPALHAALLQSVFENSIDGVIVIADNGRILSMSNAAEALFGYREEDLRGENVSKLMPSPDREQHDGYLRRYLDTGQARIIGKGREVVGLRRDGTQFPFFLNVSREVVVHDRRWFVGLIRDLSATKKIENQLRQAQKMESIGTLAGGIAHDFNNILGGIRGYVELMLDDAEQGSFLHEDLTEMLKACNRAKDLILQILTFSRRTETRPEPTNLLPIIQESLKLLRATIPTTIDIKLTFADECPWVVADPTQIHQVMMNLGTNAYHAMRQAGGTLSVDLDAQEIKPNAPINNVNLPYGNYVVLSVRDSGKGIEADLLDRVFDPFFTTKHPEEGTGMGLAVVHGIIRSHQGEVTLESELGKGTIVKVILPAWSENVPKAHSQSEEIKEGRGNILLVDDEELLLRVQSRMLSRCGYDVVSFTSGLAALQAIAKTPGRFDIVITDHAMPGMTGSSLAEQIQTLNPELPIILTTGFSQHALPGQTPSTAIREVLMKPVAKQVLLRTIRKILG